MDYEPELESLDEDGILDEIESIGPETTRDELLEKMDFLVRQLNMSHEQNRRNTLVLMEALEQSQTHYKKLLSEKLNWKYRLKLAIKKVMIGWGWYEASLDELKEIHFGQARDHIQKKGS
jgi:DNA polymerase III alpha subunit